MAANHSSGLAEAGMIEEIEHFRAHLQAHLLIELDVLEYGEIHVTKAGTDNHIAGLGDMAEHVPAVPSEWQH